MARYKIKDIWDEWYKTHDFLGEYKSFLFGEYYNAPEQQGDEPPEDTRPIWAKLYVDTDYQQGFMPDFQILNKYGERTLLFDVKDVDIAYARFFNWCISFCEMHKNELDMVAEAFTAKYNPVENYDRHEDTKVITESSAGSVAKISPDDAELFYNANSAEATTEGETGTDSHIHGNIGVTRSDELVAAVTNWYINNGLFDYLIERIISDSTILCENGIDVI